MRRIWLRRLVFFAGAVALLWGANALYFRAAAWQPVIRGAAGDVLYAAGFDAFEDEWQQYSGRTAAQITDGHLQISNDSSGTIYSAALPTFADFDATVTTTVVDGSDANEGFGMIFRLQRAATSCGMPLVVLCDLATIDALSVPLQLAFSAQETGATGYYVFLISNDGYYALLRSDDATGQAEFVTVWHEATDLINTGFDVENTIRVVGVGSDFRFFINGEQVELCVPLPGDEPTGSARNCMGERTGTWRDTRYTTGQIGMTVNTKNTPGTVVNFDNLIVTMPDNALPEGVQQ